jgi:uncharacterized protein
MIRNDRLQRLYRKRLAGKEEPAMLNNRAPRLFALACALLYSGLGAAAADDAPLPEGRSIMEKVNARNEGVTMKQKTSMQLISKQNKIREREMAGVRKYFDDERRSVLFFTKPSNVEGTAFLTYDYVEAGKEDDQWLYLPAMRKVRRISAAERGGYFMGTDFTYEDLKQGTKVPIDDFTWTTVGEETVGDAACYVVEGIPVSKAIAKELGYGKTMAYVDKEIWLARKGEFWDTNLNPLKTVTTGDIRQVQAIWTAHEIIAENHKNGHKTVMKISDVEYDGSVKDSIFKRDALQRGL